MRILYIFPHPDDESFGPARAISSQVRAGHEVSLLTLTRGGATKERHRLGLSVEKMGLARLEEMQHVAEALGLAGLTVLDLPDSGLKELDPRVIEELAADHIEHVQPDAVVTYPVHGISGFHDHLVTHAIVKRAFVVLRDRGASYMKRLAFFTLTEDQAEGGSGMHRLSGSSEAEIDCLMAVDEQDMDAFRRALDCYVTYREMIEKTGVRESLDHIVAFEFFGEDFTPPLHDLVAGL
ncbi:PIG-L deacetylase family protein [Candidatus Bipolaricaulota bacterium]